MSAARLVPLIIRPMPGSSVSPMTSPSPSGSATTTATAGAARSGAARPEGKWRCRCSSRSCIGLGAARSQDGVGGPSKEAMRSSSRSVDRLYRRYRHIGDPRRPQAGTHRVPQEEPSGRIDDTQFRIVSRAELRLIVATVMTKTAGQCSAAAAIPSRTWRPFHSRTWRLVPRRAHPILAIPKTRIPAPAAPSRSRLFLGAPVLSGIA